MASYVICFYVSASCATAGACTDFLGPSPQAYRASQLRSLRRAPADLITGRCTSFGRSARGAKPRTAVCREPANTDRELRERAALGLPMRRARRILSALISCLRTFFQNALGTFRNAITHSTLRRAPRGRPDLAGCLPRCVRTDGRVKLCRKIVPTLVEPQTFVQWVLKEEHSHRTFGQ